MTARKRRLGAALRRAGAEALLVTDPADVRYLCGFTGSNAALLVRGAGTKLAGATMFTDGRYTTQAGLEVEGAQVVIAQKPVGLEACEFAVAAGVTRCGFDAGRTTVAGLETLRAGLAPVLAAKLRKEWFVATVGLVAGLREVKDEGEQDKMRAAAALGCRLFDQVLEHVVPGATEMEVVLALEYMARLEGAERMSFETIVTGGERTALPHGRATTAKLPRRGFVMMDFGVVLEGYCSDMTRTVHLGAARRGGKAGPGEREVYEAVLEAQGAGVAAVRAGVSGSDVDEAARGVLRRAGLEEFFTHATGHGVGVEIHEGPRLGKRQEEPGGVKRSDGGVKRSDGGVKRRDGGVKGAGAKVRAADGSAAAETLKAGMVVTIEPGVYLPGRFGVRIEDTVLVTAEGCEVFTPSTKAWIEL